MDFEELLMLLVGLIVIGVIILLGWTTYDHFFVDHPTWSIRKDQWTCTQEHTSVIPIVHSNGNGDTYVQMMPTTECVNYRRRNF